ncbi:MAG TPA: 3-keto-5-aminohexanoate cleavage protein, partial [Sphaerochaeta sp.]|nr:3-keto-5-aminohexanoate cleavage protein [Sphaerochaeta sp.]
PLYFNLLLGNIAGAQASLLHAGIMINDLPENSIWALAGIGDSQLMMNSIAIASGGGVRVGLEDMIYFNEERTHLAKNEDLLQRIHQIIKANGKTMMESKKLRELLHLNPGFGLYGRKKVI